MKAPLLKLVFAFLFLIVACQWPEKSIAQDDWQVWRGPNRNGVANPQQQPPVEWNEDKNIIWKVPVPGRGHASPIIVGKQIYLATADDETQIQSVVSFDRNTGKQLWQTEVHKGGFNPRIHRNNTQAFSTVASDGKRIFAVFNNHEGGVVPANEDRRKLNFGRTQLVALDLDGKKLWEKNVANYQPQFPFGFGQSPIIYKDKVIATSESNSDSVIVAYNGKSGKEEWKIERPKTTSYSTPVVARVAGKAQLLISGGKKIYSYDPENGKELWNTDANWNVSCGTMVWQKDIVFASGGFPAGQTLAIKADGSGKKLWDNGVKVYEQSMLIHSGYLYALSDKGVAYCWKAETGEEMWRERLEGPVSASPVLVGDLIYFTSEKGSTFVVKANPKKFEQVFKNSLGQISFASPAIVDSKIYTRVGTRNGSVHQDWLYCIGKK